MDNAFPQYPPSDYRNPLADKVEDINKRLNLSIQATDRCIDQLNNKVARLEALMEKMVESIANSEGFNAVKMDKSRVDTTLRVGLNFPLIPFGYECSSRSNTDPYVTVYGGDIQIGDNTPITIADQTVSITADNTYVYLRHTYSDATTSIQADTTKPVSDGTYYKHPLCLIGKVGNSIWVQKYLYLGGNIIIPAIFKPTPIY